MTSPNKTPTPDDKHGPKTVDITINGIVYPVRPGNHPVAQLKTIPTPNIPQEDTLCEMVGGVPQPIVGDHVDIKGGEIFASNCPGGGAS